MNDQAAPVRAVTQWSLYQSVAGMDASAILDRVCGVWDPIVERFDAARFLLTAIREERQRTRTEG